MQPRARLLAIGTVGTDPAIGTVGTDPAIGTVGTGAINWHLLYV